MVGGCFPPAESVVETLEKNDFPDVSGDSHDANTISSRDLNNESNDRESLWLWFAILVAILLTGEMLYSRPKSLTQEIKFIHETKIPRNLTA